MFPEDIEKKFEEFKELAVNVKSNKNKLIFLVMVQAHQYQLMVLKISQTIFERSGIRNRLLSNSRKTI